MLLRPIRIKTPMSFLSSEYLADGLDIAMTLKDAADELNLIGEMFKEVMGGGHLRFTEGRIEIYSSGQVIAEKYFDMGHTLRRLPCKDILEAYKYLKDSSDGIAHSMKALDTCDWKFTDDDVNGPMWHPSCTDVPHCFIEGSISDNKYKYCPSCGKLICDIRELKD